jgi:hypothetical protein
MKYAIETHTFCDGWVNTWTDDDETPVVFDTLQKAQDELSTYLFGLFIDVDLGIIEDYSADDFRISEVK